MPRNHPHPPNNSQKFVSCLRCHFRKLKLSLNYRELHKQKKPKAKVRWQEQYDRSFAVAPSHSRIFSDYRHISFSISIVALYTFYFNYFKCILIRLIFISFFKHVALGGGGILPHFFLIVPFFLQCLPNPPHLEC